MCNKLYVFNVVATSRFYCSLLYELIIRSFDIPKGKELPAGYIVMQYTAKESRIVKSYLKWVNRIPYFYSKYVLNNNQLSSQTVEEDDNCIGLLKHYRSLAPMLMEATQAYIYTQTSRWGNWLPVYAVQKCYDDFKTLTEKIVSICK